MVGFGGPEPQTEFNVQLTCPDIQYDMMVGMTGFLLTGLDRLNTFSADGRSMQGSCTFEDYNGVHTFAWNLGSERK
jgi:hypothetical protein